MTDWPVEEIPPEQTLYLRVHHSDFQDGDVQPGAFKTHEGAISMDWCKYSTPAATRARARDGPVGRGVLSLNVGDALSIRDVVVKHSPIRNHPVYVDNRAHTDVTGSQSKPRVRAQLLEIVSIEIAPDDPVEDDD